MRRGFAWRARSLVSGGNTGNRSDPRTGAKGPAAPRRAHRRHGSAPAVARADRDGSPPRPDEQASSAADDAPPRRSKGGPAPALDTPDHTPPHVDLGDATRLWYVGRRDMADLAAALVMGTALLGLIVWYFRA